MKTDEFAGAFLAYYQTFPHEEMNDLKLAHTRRVVENARLIMAAEGFDEVLRRAGEAAAWVHDVGRFEQFKRYRTFSDRQSVNHALLSCAEVLRLGWLDDWSAQERNAVLGAVAYHNLREVPAGLPEREGLLAQMVRDADKLDIFTVLDEAMGSDYLPTHPEVYWGLPFAKAPSEGVVRAIEEGRSVDYGEIRCFADFVFIQLAWCHGGLYFRESARLALARGEVEIRRRYLCEILPGSRAVIERCCAVAERYLHERAGV